MANYVWPVDHNQSSCYHGSSWLASIGQMVCDCGWTWSAMVNSDIMTHHFWFYNCAFSKSDTSNLPVPQVSVSFVLCWHWIHNEWFEWVRFCWAKLRVDVFLRQKATHKHGAVLLGWTTQTVDDISNENYIDF